VSGRGRPLSLECTLCGLSVRNDEGTVWSDGPDRDPFCSEECLRLANAKYVFDRHSEREDDAT
jgi:endogenous inhibitor of DNA gyrase (YacG/DUF329 family)